MRHQRTIKKTISCSGVGLHTGKISTITLKPAQAGTGVFFKRIDLDGLTIKAIANNTAATSYATTLSRNTASVKTVEHLLAALAGMQIDNVHIDIDEEEVPIMDGSARPFAKCIVDAGIATQTAWKPVLKIIKPVFVRDGDKQLAIWPAETLKISYFIDFNHPLLREQSYHYQPSEDSFLRDISDARTFGFLSDVATLRANGLAKGASLENAVALDKDSVVNSDGLRHKDEFVRHKILDLIGDLSLIGMPVIGHIVAHKSGHGLNALMVSKLLANPQHCLLIGSPDAIHVHNDIQQPLHAAF